MPVAVLRDAAVAHNIAAVQAFADRNGARLCPHGKTSLSPELFTRQLAAGAWGMTAATAHHVRLYRRLGIERVFLANQLAGRADVDLVLGEVAADPGFDFYCLVDSADAVAALGPPTSRPPLQVLVETGAVGARAGARNVAQALAAARAAAGAGLALRGVETFEGVRQTADEARAGAGAMIDLAVAAARAIAAEGLFADAPVLLSAGGSAFLDLCAAKLPAEIGGRPVERVIRPGCYVTHDHGLYAALARVPELKPAMEVWGAVLSVPEPELAVVGVGKRDVSHDSGPPVPLHVHRPGDAGPPRPAEAMAVASLWDQHLSLAMPAGVLRVGDLVGFGISHPCATFDRWTALFTVDPGYRVTGAVTTLF